MDFTDSRGIVIPLPPGEPVSWRVSGYALIRDHQGRYLMVQSGGGLWHFPGGGIEESETIAEGVVREVLEETGYRLSPKGHTFFALHEQRFYHSGEKRFYHSLQLFYTARISGSVPDESRMTEHDKTRPRAWLSPHTLRPETVHSSIVKVVKELTQRFA